MKNKLKYLLMLFSVFILFSGFSLTCYAAHGLSGNEAHKPSISDTSAKASNSAVYNYQTTGGNQTEGGNYTDVAASGPTHKHFYTGTVYVNGQYKQLTTEGPNDDAAYKAFQEMAKQMHARIDDSDTEFEEVEKDVRTDAGQRQYGLSAFYLKVQTSHKASIAQMEQDIEREINKGNAEPLGSANFKKNNSFPTTYILDDIEFTEAQMTKLSHMSSSSSPADFFNAVKETTIGLKKFDEMNEIFAAFEAGTGDYIPVIFLTPAVGTQGGTANNITLRLNTIVSDHAQYLKDFQNKSGSGLVTKFVASGTSSMTGSFVEVFYMFPYSGGGGIVPKSTITGICQSQHVIHRWAQESTATGKYTVKVNIKSQPEIVDNGIITIDLYTDFAGSQFNDLTQTLDTEYQKDTSHPGIFVPPLFAKYERQVSSTHIQYELPAGLIATWNSEWSATYAVNVTGGTPRSDVEEKVGLYAYATLNGEYAEFEEYPNFEFWTKYQNGGQMYISFLDGEVKTEDTPYDKHSTTTPIGTGILVADDAEVQDWNVAVGIPSTETTTAIVDGEIGMYDIAGYLCARNYHPGNREQLSEEGDQTNWGSIDDTTGDNIGVEQSAQAVDRVIEIKTTVKNCWGGGNLPDQLSRTCIGSASGGSAYPGDTASNVNRETGHSYSGHSSHSQTGTFDIYDVEGYVHAFNCNGHDAAIKWSTNYFLDGKSHHGSCGVVVGKDADNNDITCGGDEGSDSSGSHSPSGHNCTWNWAVYDAIGDDWLGKTTGFPDTGDETYYSAHGTTQSISGTNYALTYGLIELSTSIDTGRSIKLHVTWSPSKDRQYYVVSYDVTTPDVYSVSGRNEHPLDANLSTSNQKGIVPDSGNNEDGVISEDFTHGTGSTVEQNENMIHHGTHTYTITYHETIDAYAYRTITDAAIYSLIGIEIKHVHQIARNEYRDMIGNDYDADTLCAPLEAKSKGQGVSAPDAIGYLFRCCGPENGQYQDRNGRIEFEAWKNSRASFGGNTTVELSNSDYYLGDVTVNLITIQDHIYGESITNEDTYEANADAGITDRGDSEHRYHGIGKSDDVWIPTASDDKYTRLHPAGDCTGNYSSADNDPESHSEMCRKELMTLYHYWCNENKAEDYKANVISDTFVYGGTQGLTTVICDDAHAVDDGVMLFNVVIDVEGCPLHIGEDNVGEKTVYRNHMNCKGIDADTLRDCIFNDEYTDKAVKDGEPLPLASETGGNTSMAETTAYCLQKDLLSCTASGGSAGKPVSFSKGDNISDASVYTGRIDITHDSQTPGSGTVEINVSTSGTTQNRPRYDLYWNNHIFKGMGTVTTKIKCISTIEDETPGKNYENNGEATKAAYGGKLTISDLGLVRWTPNGMWNTAQAGADYLQTKLVDAGIPVDDDWEYNQAVADNHELIANEKVTAPCGNNGGYLSQIFIYNPVTSEFDQVIGEQEGAWAENVADETMYDQRIDASGEYYDQAKLSEKDDKYVVQSRSVWSWVSPIGNFSGIGWGEGSPGADTAPSSTGTVQRNLGRKGYVDGMNVDCWIQGETIRYPFVAGISNTSFTTEIDSEIPLSYHSYTAGGGGVGKGAGPVTIFSDKLLNKLKFGAKVMVTDTCNLVEAKDANIVYTTYAINPYIMDSESELYGTAHGEYLPQETRNDNKKANAAYKTDTIDLVGSIGNLSIHDTTDFRFSEFFKEKLDPEEWLIEDVIYKTNSGAPKNIVSSHRDIMLKEAKGNSNKHNSLGTTKYSVDPYLGLAGNFEILPLVPRYNTNDNYKKDCLRIGYKAYGSIETIGNYQSYINPSETTPTGSKNSTGDTFEHDTRKHYLEINSVYYLYDLDSGKFYDIDIWSGPSGAKERLYNGTTHKPEAISVSGEIFQNVKEEYPRRNISDKLYEMSAYLSYTAPNDEGLTSPTIYNSDVHYIGTPGKLKLDNRDLVYIGSSANLTDKRFWGNYDSIPPVYDLSNTAQQYHFTTGLTSTSIITAPMGNLDAPQTTILNANQELQKAHPHAVIVQFDDYIAHGTIWTLRLNGSQVNLPEFQIYKDNTYPDGFSNKADDPVVYRNTPVYKIDYDNDPSNDVVVKVPGTSIDYRIDKDITPVLVMEAYKTSADDKAVEGTH